jgi:circadian clock protein KaiC
VLLLDDRTSEGPDLQLQSIAHGVISLEHTAPVYGRALRQLRVVKFRGSDFSSGFHHVRLHRAGVQVFPRLAAAEHGADFQPGRLESGVPALDSLLGGGIDLGSSTLVVGPAGSGKSTLALQYAGAAARRGEHARVFTFDESRQTMLARLRGLGMPLPDGTGPGQVAVHQVDPAEISPGQFAHMVRDAVEADHARVIVIDSLNGYMNAMPEAGFLSTHLHEVLTYLGQRGVATFLVGVQQGIVGNNMSTGMDVSYMADNVLILRYFEAQGAVQKAISVFKKRGSVHENTLRQFDITTRGIVVGPVLSNFQGVLTGVPTILPPGATHPGA